VDRRNVLIFACASLVAWLLGIVYLAVTLSARLNLSSAAFGGLLALFVVGGALGFVAWLLGLSHAAARARWDWLIIVLVLGPLGALLYALQPGTERGA
jgi:cytochrome bd-type quinol oxidase subunit 2